ncbi:hypothetical protein D3C71_1479060 [compost metagenome]
MIHHIRQHPGNAIRWHAKVVRIGVIIPHNSQRGDRPALREPLQGKLQRMGHPQIPGHVFVVCDKWIILGIHGQGGAHMQSLGLRAVLHLELRPGLPLAIHVQAEPNANDVERIQTSSGRRSLRCIHGGILRRRWQLRTG